MLIIIEYCYAQHLIEADDREIEKFEDLLILHEKGIHYLCAKRSTVLIIKKKLVDKISVRSKRILDLMATQSVGIEDLTSKLDFFAVIKFNEILTIEKEVQTNRIVWNLSIDQAIKWLSLPPKLYGENLEDSKLFLSIGRHFGFFTTGSNKSLSFQLDHTGGCGEASKILEQRISESNAACIIIIDSDKLTDQHTGSPAIHKCASILIENKGLAYFHCIEEREIENSISIDIVKLAIERSDIKGADKVKLMERVSFLGKFKLQNPIVYKYIDLKEGTCVYNVNGASSAVKVFYKMEPNGDNCTSHANCKFYTPPICKNILEHVRDYISAIPPREIGSLYPLYGDTWQNIGRKVFSLGISNQIRNT